MKFQDYPYQRVEMDALEQEYRKLMNEFDAAGGKEEQFAVHQKYYKLIDAVNTMVEMAQIRHDIDITDEFYRKEQDYYDSVMPKIQNLSLEYQKKLYESPYRPYLEEKIGPVAFKNIELSIKSMEDKLIPLMQEENSLTTEYDNLIAGAKIDWEKDVLNLSLLRPYLTHKDRSIRKMAWEKYAGFFEENGEALDDIYDRLVKNRTKQAKMLGYDNYLTLGYYRMKRNCYDADMVKKFRDQIKKYFVPFVEKLHERRRTRLGLTKLSCVDESVYFTEGNPMPQGTPEEILANGQKMYEELSPETAEFINFMMEHSLFDVLGRKNKKAGGYMTYLPLHKAPFIFANFNGTSGDVDVITHECGHAFQGFVAAKDPIREHVDITMETAEVHSMAMEFFTEPWMEKFFGDRAEDYKAMHMEEAAAFIPYGCMVDEFQHVVYENPDMTPAQRHKAWNELEKEYKPHLDFTGFAYFEKGGFWQKQPHIYGLPLYYIDYCLAGTCALQYKVMMEENYQKAWESYLKLCQLSAADFFTGLLKQVGVKSPFEAGSIKELVEKLEKRI